MGGGAGLIGGSSEDTSSKASLSTAFTGGAVSKGDTTYNFGPMGWTTAQMLMFAGGIALLIWSIDHFGRTHRS